MGKGRWKEQVKCKWWSATERKSCEMQDYTPPWSEYGLDDLFSLSNIESLEKRKKNLHSIKLLKDLFWKENVIVGGNVWQWRNGHQMWQSRNKRSLFLSYSPYSALIVVVSFPSILWKCSREWKRMQSKFAFKLDTATFTVVFPFFSCGLSMELYIQIAKQLVQHLKCGLTLELRCIFNLHIHVREDCDAIRKHDHESVVICYHRLVALLWVQQIKLWSESKTLSINPECAIPTLVNMAET